MEFMFFVLSHLHLIAIVIILFLHCNQFCPLRSAIELGEDIK
jgi:hypothetical protein